MQSAATTLDALQKRWLLLCDNLGIVEGIQTWKRLDAGYGSATRHYHDWQHIEQCLQWYDVLRNHTNPKVVVEVAIWFHDVIYDSTRNDNEKESALLAEEVLRGLTMAEDVKKMIEATTHRSPPDDEDTALLCDIDLSILGADAEQYDAYAKAVRLEYDWVNDADFRVGRARVLGTFLEKPFIYSLTACRDKWEAMARDNIAREIEQLEN